MLSTIIVGFLLYAAGISNAKGIGNRIIGGSPARAGEFPFSAALTIYAANGQYFCGGALVSENFVLTAAQCCQDALRFTLILGTNKLSGTDSTRVTVSADEYFLHPEYSPATLENDIALIKLRSSLRFNDYLFPIRLPTSDLKTYDAAVATGWGQTSDDEGGHADVLNRVTVTVVSNDECRVIYGNQISDGMVCAEGNYNEGTCTGDSGSPLVQYTLGPLSTHVGVASFFSGNGCESLDPSGFTRTFTYVDWIRNITGLV